MRATVFAKRAKHAVLLVAALLVVTLIVTAFHGHEDGRLRVYCPVCAAWSHLMASEPVGVVVLVPLIVCFLRMARPADARPLPAPALLSPRNRAPPA